ERDRQKDASFRQAHEAVNYFCIQAGDSSLDAYPALRSRRREWLETGLKYYEAFLQERSTDPAVRGELPSAPVGHGLVCSGLKDPVKAAKSYERAISIYEELLRENPGNVRFGTELARNMNNLAITQSARGQMEECRKTRLQALALLEQVYRAAPENI